jgi:hypothetical protein
MLINKIYFGNIPSLAIIGYTMSNTWGKYNKYELFAYVFHSAITPLFKNFKRPPLSFSH